MRTQRAIGSQFAQPRVWSGRLPAGFYSRPFMLSESRQSDEFTRKEDENKERGGRRRKCRKLATIDGKARKRLNGNETRSAEF